MIMDAEMIEVSNHEGIAYSIPLKFIAKETHVGDKYLSYQLLRLRKTGLFSIEELYRIASLIESKTPDHLIDWTATFLLLDNPPAAKVNKKLRELHLV
jgi:hypothetical protein